MPYTFAQVIADPLLRMTETLFVSIEYGGEQQIQTVLCWESDAVVTQGDYRAPDEFWATKPDIDGNCILRIPSDHIDRIYTEAEATGLMRCIEANMQMLARAY